MNVKTRITGLMLSMLLGSGMAVAGPDKTTSLFMDTTASLFDLGMHKLNIRLSNVNFINVGFEEKLASPTLSASYIWDNDKIKISVNYFMPYADKGDKAYVREVCLLAFSNLRIDALVKPQTGKLYDFTPTTGWAQLFDHSGYSKGGVTKEVVNLDNKFILSCYWKFKDNSLGTMVIEASLLSNSYSEKML